jgi:hypothetical protein
MQLLSLSRHHGEPVDPDLLSWLLDKIHDVLSVGPLAGVIAFGALILVPPLLIFGIVWLRRRSAGAASRKSLASHASLQPGKGDGGPVSS